VNKERLFDVPLNFIETMRTEMDESALKMLLNPGLAAKAFPSTSSLGRLFDAVAALLFFGMRSQYEGQAAMQLEWKMSTATEKPYPFDIYASDSGLILSPESMFHALIEDLTTGISEKVISRRFHEGVVDGFARMCGLARESTGLNIVALSGGCFQNAFLESALHEELSKRGFRVLSHHHVPPNDGGVALGQAVIANAQGD
jgi:hydrogenase maturation protein HypF